MFVCKGVTGETYHIEEPVSENAIGAEGKICTIVGKTDIVAKIYHAEILEDTRKDVPL